MSTIPEPAAVQEMVDEAAIAKLQRRYMFALDWCDADVMASLFTDDGVLAWPGGKVEGRDQVHTMFTRAAAAPNRTGNVRHMVANTVIDVQGDAARARAYWFDVDKDAQTNLPFVLAYGHYEDELVRTGEGWRFKHRTVFNQLINEGVAPATNPAW